MTQVDNLTDFANQQTVLILEDGTTAALDIIFSGASERWTANLEYLGRIINGIGLCDHPNILRQWKNLIPFGLAVVTPDMTDPFSINDFSSERVKLYLLNAAEVQQVETEIFTAP